MCLQVNVDFQEWGGEEGYGPITSGLSMVSLAGLKTNQRLEMLLSGRALDYYV